MKIAILPSLIQVYKNQMESILLDKEEIYKWRAVSHFQNNWFRQFDGYREKLEVSTQLVYNLMDGGSTYLPRRNLLTLTELEPLAIEQLINNLYQQSIPLDIRLDRFDEEVKRLNFIHKVSRGNKTASLDMRSAMVLLCLRYPDEYYFYKYDMFQYVIGVLNYSEKLIKGRSSNVLKFQNFCEIVKQYILADNELLQLHANFLGPDCYSDTNHNILTQDIIYSIQEYLPVFTAEVADDDSLTDVVVGNMEDYAPVNQPTKGGQPAKINFHEKHLAQKRIGDKGEIFVMNWEIDKLVTAELDVQVYYPKHSSIEQGDGLGYDILSYDGEKNKIYIEVKTTTGNFSTPFYISRRELEVSRKKGDQYYLYRIYNFDVLTMKGDIIIHRGKLDQFCKNPSEFKCILSRL